MALTPGTKLGPYEILSAAGAGGMGEVYRAKDTRLDRTVAIKVLPEHLSADPEAKQRFEREAKAISSINHPNLCILHDIGDQSGIDYLVMEYLDGESLASRLNKGPLPVDQVLRYGIDICEGLGKAHASGITHRDLKPGNIMLTKSGAKLMDFGLAKMSTPAINQPASGMTATLSSPAAGSQPLTAQGSMVGTFQYMSPEQVEGKEADARSDIFALGAVLFEMATGKRAFEGKTPASVIAAVLERDPAPISSLQPMSPPALDMLVRTCMAKNPDERWQTAHDVKLQLKQMQMMGSQISSGVVAVPHRKSKDKLAWGIAVGMALIAILALAHSLTLGSKPTRVLRTQLNFPENLKLNLIGDFAGPIALSPDGTKIVFSAEVNNKTTLFVQSMDSFSPQPIPGTENGTFPFWSPDSRSLAFFSGGKMRRVELNGGPALTIADAPLPRGGSWGKNGDIIFTPSVSTGIWMVPASGGQAKEIIKLDTTVYTSCRWPSFMPDGKHFVYLAANHNSPQSPEMGIFFASVDGSQNTKLVHSLSSALFTAGNLLYQQDAVLMAQPLDPGSGKFTGDSFVVSDKVHNDMVVWHGLFTTADDGMLVFQPGSRNSENNIQWLDRSGKMVDTVAEHEYFYMLRIAPDGKRFAAVTITGGSKGVVWLYDLAKKSRSRITFDDISFANLAWSPDGAQLAYNGFTNGIQDSFIYTKPVSGAGEQKILLGQDSGKTIGQSLVDWSPDGKNIVYWRSHFTDTAKQQGRPGYQLWVMPLGGGTPKPYSDDFGMANTGQFSPDGRWLAYISNLTGRDELFVAPFPWTGAKWQVSNGGARNPHWRKDAKELIYEVPGQSQLAAVEVDGHGNTFTVSEPHILFRVPMLTGAGFNWDMTPDGQRFLMITTGDSATQVPLTVLQNWTGLQQKK